MSREVEDIQLVGELAKRVRRDRVVLNNPVIMQGLGLAPLIIVATTLQNAILLSVAVFLILVPTRIFGALFGRVTFARFRGVMYAVVAGCVYIGAYWVMTHLFQSANIVMLGLYLPLLVVEPIVLKRYERLQNEEVDTAVSKGIITAVGYSLVLLVAGAGRELLGAGTLLGTQLLPFAPLPLAQLPAGGFILLALLMAVWRSAARVLKRSMALEMGGGA